LGKMCWLVELDLMIFIMVKDLTLY
jgi:hypothetical protein